MLAVTSYQVLTVVQIQTDFSYNSQTQWYYQFMKPEWLDDPTPIGSTFAIYAISDLQQFTLQVVQNYYNLGSPQMFDKIEQEKDPKNHGEIRAVEMTIRNIDNHDQTDVHYLTPDYMGPL